MENKIEKSNFLELSEREEKCFSSAIRYIMETDEEWQTLDEEKGNELVKKAYEVYISNPLEEKQKEQAFANAMYFLLKEIGHKNDMKDMWSSTLQHAACDDKPTGY